jgi:hypothetical protein
VSVRAVCRVLLGTITPAALFSAAAPAQDPAPTEDVIVTARERTVVEQFLQDVADPTRTGQVPVWEQKICPAVIGMEDSKAAVLAERIGQVAALVDLQAKPGCRTNTLVIVSGEAKALSEGIARRFAVRLRTEGRSRVTKFGASDRPVRWISQTDIGTGDGSPLIGGPNEPRVGRMSGSRLKASTRTMIHTMLIVVDVNQVVGTSLGALGDYLGMVAVARPAPERHAPSASILSMFDRPDAPRAVTDHDRAYLTALYHAPMGATGQIQRSTMRARMEKEGDAAE